MTESLRAAAATTEAAIVDGSGSTRSQEDLAEQTNQRQAIEQLAYALWQERGCPAGSPECDWLEAEKRLGDASVATR